MNQENTLRTLMVEEVRDLYDAERQLVKALPKMAKGATSEELRELIETHLEETKGHVERLEQVFEMLSEKPRAKHCKGIAGIIQEGSEMLGEDFEGAVMDAAIIAGAQRAEHYEMGAYGSVIAWAEELGEDQIASLLRETLEEEKGADQKLSALAEGTINTAAASGQEDDEEEEEQARPRAGRSGRSMAASGSRGGGGSSASRRR